MPETLLDRSRLKAAIFDVDGTLYEQAPLRRALAVRLVRAHLRHPVRGYGVAAYRCAQEDLRAHAVQVTSVPRRSPERRHRPAWIRSPSSRS